MRSKPISTLPPRERLLFQHFWTLLSLASAGASWAIWGWLLGERIPVQSVWGHAAVIVALTLIYRACAAVLEQKDDPPVVVKALGQTFLAIGFASGTTLAGFLVVASAWAVFNWLLSLGLGRPAVAGVSVIAAPFVEVPFRPIGVVTIVGSLLVQLYGFAIGFRRTMVRELPVTIAGLPEAFDGYRILHLSDVHLGPLCHRGALREILARAHSLLPDLVCVTGDLVDSPNTDLASWVPELRAVTARDGVLTILGNHDRHAGSDRVAAALRQMTDWRVLRNEATSIARGTAQLHIVGIEDAPHDDAVAAAQHLARALPSGAAAIALIHHPWVFDAVAPLGIPLTLAGHSHGGQLAVPLAPQINMARVLGIRRSVDSFYERGCRLIVSRGIGTSGQRVRIGAPRELTVLRLTAIR